MVTYFLVLYSKGFARQTCQADQVVLVACFLQMLYHDMQKVPCTVQSLETHENQNLTYSSSLRDFAVLISLVRGSILASVRLFCQRLNGRGYEHGYSPIAKACHCATYIQQNCK